MSNELTHFEKETHLSIRDALSGSDALSGKNRDTAKNLLEKLVKGFVSIPQALHNIHSLGNLLLASGIHPKWIETLLGHSSHVLFQMWPIDNILDYMIQFQKQDPEIYNYITGYDEKAVLISKGCHPIDTEYNFKENIRWLKAYNKKFLKDIFHGRIPDCNASMEHFISAAFRTEEHLYVCIKRIWHKIPIPLKGSSINPENAVIALLYHMTDIHALADFIYSHTPLVLLNDILKLDRYVIMNLQLSIIGLQLFDWHNLEKGNFRVHFILEGQWKQRFVTFIKNGYFMPKKIIAGQEYFESINSFAGPVSNYYENILPRARAQKLSQIYTESYLPELRQKYHNDISKLRIMILTSRHSTYVQYASEELKKGFKSIGCRAVLIRERRHQGIGYTVEFIFRIIDRFRPHMILAINNFRSPYLSQFVPNIPFVTWIHDYPENLPNGCDNITDNDFIFAATRADLEKRLPETFPVLKDKPIHLLPFIRNEGQAISCVFNSRKKYDTGYISNVFVLPEVASFYVPEKKTGTNVEKIIHDFIRQLETCQPSELASILVSKEKCLELAQATLKRLNLTMTPPLSLNDPLVIKTLRFHVGHFLQKTLPIKYLIENGMTNLFLGGQGWEMIPLYKPYAKGLIPHKDLYRVMDDIAVNLNLSAVITFHPKVGEALEANSFFISSWKGDADDLAITEFFKEDEEVVLFKTYEELTTKIKYYLLHPEERERITQRARKKFFSLFSAEKGCEKIVHTVLGMDERKLF